MSFLSALMPRERHFFTLFNKHADLVIQGARLQVQLLDHYGDATERAQLIEKIQQTESAADAVTHETIALMHTTFVTPFDRDQINRLISRLDDILDLIQDTAETLHLYDIQKIDAEAKHLANLVQICCERVQHAVSQLSSMDNSTTILKTCQEIDKLESDADRVMRSAMSKLFREEADVRQLIKYKAIYELLETTTDKCQDVANVIEGVVLENA